MSGYVPPTTFYLEPHWCDERLFEVEPFNRSRPLLDPCCGSGRVTTAARQAGYRVQVSDIVDRELFPMDRVQDFLKRKHVPLGAPWCATHLLTWWRSSPVMRSHWAAHKVALLFPNARLNAAHWLWVLPLRRVWYLSPRPSMPPYSVIARGERPGGGKTDYCWLVFERGYVGQPEMHQLSRAKAGKGEHR
jgi:hypothetical protein